MVMCLGDEEEKAAKLRERRDIYNKAVAARKKLVNFTVGDFSNTSNLWDRAACEQFRTTVPKLNEGHRLFPVSFNSQ